MDKEIKTRNKWWEEDKNHSRATNVEREALGRHSNIRASARAAGRRGSSPREPDTFNSPYDGIANVSFKESDIKCSEKSNNVSLSVNEKRKPRASIGQIPDGSDTTKSDNKDISNSLDASNSNAEDSPHYRNGQSNDQTVPVLNGAMGNEIQHPDTSKIISLKELEFIQNYGLNKISFNVVKDSTLAIIEEIDKLILLYQEDKNYLQNDSKVSGVFSQIIKQDEIIITDLEELKQKLIGETQ